MELQSTTKRNSLFLIEFFLLGIISSPIRGVIDTRKLNNKYLKGDIVWAKFDKYPYWPGRIASEEVTTRLQKHKNMTTGYGVLFFGDNLEYALIQEAHLQKYEPGKHTSEEYKEELESAIKMVENCGFEDPELELEDETRMNRRSVRMMKNEEENKKRKLGDENENKGTEKTEDLKDDVNTDVKTEETKTDDEVETEAKAEDTKTEDIMAEETNTDAQTEENKQESVADEAKAKEVVAAKVEEVEAKNDEVKAKNEEVEAKKEEVEAKVEEVEAKKEEVEQEKEETKKVAEETQKVENVIEDKKEEMREDIVADVKDEMKKVIEQEMKKTDEKENHDQK